jgi:hypothetical protein
LLETGISSCGAGELPRTSAWTAYAGSQAHPHLKQLLYDVVKGIFKMDVETSLSSSTPLPVQPYVKNKLLVLKLKTQAFLYNSCFGVPFPCDIFVSISATLSSLPGIAACAS